MRTRTVSFTVVLVISALLLTMGLTFAGKSDDLNSVKKEMSSKQKELNEGRKEEKELAGQINGIESQIASTQTEMAALQINISQKEKEIAAVQGELAKIEAQMAEQNDSLSKRLRAMYKNGDAGFMEIILGSENITDFMTNMDMVQKIFDNDMNVLKEIETQQAKVKAQKDSLQKLQTQLIASKSQQAEKQASLQANKDKVAAMKNEVSAENAATEKQLASLAAEADKMTAEIQALQSNSPNTQYLGSGKLGWPVSGRITSGFVNRNNPITGRAEKHLGLDIAVPSGTPVAAAEGGTVIKAGWNNSYGNMVIVDHGGGIATLYAHNSRLAVSVGTAVTRGQTVAYAGSTGDSTGPHCHFEVRVNGQYQNPMGWL